MQNGLLPIKAVQVLLLQAVQIRINSALVMQHLFLKPQTLKPELMITPMKLRLPPAKQAKTTPLKYL